jgi:hypothetical protein
MSLPAPILVISERHDRRLASALAAAGASAIIERPLAEAAAAIARETPAAVVFADADIAPIQSTADDIMDVIDAAPAPFMPVLARVNDCGATIMDVLPVNAAAAPEQIVARLAAALRVRTLHATVLRRIDTLRNNGADVPALPSTDPLEEATILVAGRGRSYPALTAAVGERVGLIGALSVENAARHLNTREIDGVILGEGFGPSTNVAFLTALLEDSRFRDLPVGVVPDIPPGIDRTRLCGLEPVHGEPEDIVGHLLPLVRLHAFGSRLRRHVATLDSRGLIDPQTGLSTVAAFEGQLPRVITNARERGMPVSIARFALPFCLNLRSRIDAARLVSRLIRPIDFACQSEDGAIIVVFAEQALRKAHVIARRIAAVMRQTVLESQGDRLEAVVTLACLKSGDNAQSLLARVCEATAAAAE